MIEDILCRECAGLCDRAKFERDLTNSSLHDFKTLLRPVSTPLDLNHGKVFKSSSDSSPDPVLVQWFRTLIGECLWIGLTRPDIWYAVTQLARIVSNPSRENVEQLDHLLRYLAGTADHALIVGGWTDDDKVFPHGFHTFADASHKNEHLDFRGVTGVIIRYLGTPIQWVSQVQSIVAASSAEDEYYAYSIAGQLVQGLRFFLQDLGVVFDEIPILHGDNQAAIAISSGPTGRGRSRHIDFRVALCRDYVRQKLIRLQYCPTERMMADVLTKQPSVVIFKRHVGILVVSIPVFLRTFTAVSAL